jgi:hypothetical protein
MAAIVAKLARGGVGFAKTMPKVQRQQRCAVVEEIWMTAGEVRLVWGARVKLAALSQADRGSSQ